MAGDRFLLKHPLCVLFLRSRSNPKLSNRKIFGQDKDNKWIRSSVVLTKSLIRITASGFLCSSFSRKERPEEGEKANRENR